MKTTLSLLIIFGTAIGCSVAVSQLTTTQNDYILSDAEAGYNQAHYDECVDSFDDPSEVDACLISFGLDALVQQ